MPIDPKLNSSWWALRLGLGLAAFLAGLDKFFNLLTDWSMYLSPAVERLLPFSAKALMLCIGPIEMVVGLAILTRCTRLGAYFALAWLLCISLNLIVSGTFYDLAVRDIELAIAAYVLATLTEIRQKQGDGAFAPCLTTGGGE